MCVCVCVLKDDDIMESEMDGSVTFKGVKSNGGKRGRTLTLNLRTKCNCVVNFVVNCVINFTSRPRYILERSPVPIELEAGMVPDAV